MTQLRPPRPESADAVVARITSGMNIFVHGAAATPTELLEALARRTDLENVRLDAPSCSPLHRTAIEVGVGLEVRVEPTLHNTAAGLAIEERRLHHLRQCRKQCAIHDRQQPLNVLEPGVAAQWRELFA